MSTMEIYNSYFFLIDFVNKYILVCCFSKRKENNKKIMIKENFIKVNGRVDLVKFLYLLFSKTEGREFIEMKKDNFHRYF